MTRCSTDSSQAILRQDNQRLGTPAWLWPKTRAKTQIGTSPTGVVSYAGPPDVRKALREAAGGEKGGLARSRGERKEEKEVAKGEKDVRQTARKPGKRLFLRCQKGTMGGKKIRGEGQTFPKLGQMETLVTKVMGKVEVGPEGGCLGGGLCHTKLSQKSPRRRADRPHQKKSGSRTRADGIGPEAGPKDCRGVLGVRYEEHRFWDKQSVVFLFISREGQLGRLRRRNTSGHGLHSAYGGRRGGGSRYRRRGRPKRARGAQCGLLTTSDSGLF